MKDSDTQEIIDEITIKIKPYRDKIFFMIAPIIDQIAMVQLRMDDALKHNLSTKELKFRQKEMNDFIDAYADMISESLKTFKKK